MVLPRFEKEGRSNPSNPILSKHCKLEALSSVAVFIELQLLQLSHITLYSLIKSLYNPRMFVAEAIN